MTGRIACAVLVAAAMAGCSSSSSPPPVQDAGPTDAGHPTDAGPTDAGVTVAGFVDQLEIVTTYDAYGGAQFGDVGVYEVVTGIVHGKLDPNNAANAIVADLSLAPVGSDGMVAYTTDFVILRPKNAAAGKRILFYDVNNRGNQLAQGFINNGGAGFAAGTEGDGLLLRLGYTIVWSGWQGNILQTGHGDTAAIGANFPIAHYADGGTITGMSREEEIFDNGTTPITFAVQYPAASLDQSSVEFNYRETWLTAGGQTWDSPSTAIPTSAWTWAADGIHVTLNRAGLGDNGAIYSFIYTAKDPVVMGIGFPAVRDFVRFLRNDTADAQGNANPLNDFKNAECAIANCNKGTNYDLAIMEGVSQSGRFARDFLWQGYNNDSTGNKVFEGFMPIIPGSRKTWTNFRWSQPGRFSKQHEDHFQRNDQFPFAYNVTTDPVSGLTDGIFMKCLADDTCPLVMHIDGGYETWGARDQLISTDGRGNDIAVPDTVRLYVVPGVNHGGGLGVGTQTKPVQCVTLNSPINERQTIRALVPALEAWLRFGTEPPASQWPSVTAGTAADPTNRTAVGFPDLSMVGLPYGGNIYNELFVTDYSNAIPVADLTKPYKVLVSTTDVDGNDVAGIRTPDVVAPIATYTSWNIRTTNYAPGDSCSTNGAMVPFASTPGTRVAGDTRLSLSERYTSHADYVSKVTAAANALVSQRLLLPEDVSFYVNAAQAAPIP
jgi:Alpha/beta hydrolase domain